MKILLPLIVLCLTIFLLQREPLILAENPDREVGYQGSVLETEQLEALPAFPGKLLHDKYTELTGRINDLILFNQ